MMELTYLLFTGSLAGLISILGHSVLWSFIELTRPRVREAVSGQVQISEALLHMLAGILLGFLFWLSWGLAAVVDVSWWVRGLTFGAIPAVVALAPLANSFFSGRADRTLTVVFASRWLTTCVVVGLSCAWSSARSM